jgi:signal transduction histidine kinase
MRYEAFGIVIGLMFVSLVILFCVLFGKLYIRKIRSYTQVIYQKDIDFQKTLNSTIIETQEQVLHNISRDLHDDAGQQLTFINFQLENLKLDSPELHLVLAPLSESVGNLAGSIRSISHSLNNQLLMKQDLLKAIRSETERLQHNGSVAINLTTDNGGKVFSTNEKIVIYRIFQEIINNAFKHAKAGAIDIGIHTNPTFMMTVRDNGKGFRTAEAEAKNTLGMQNMRERAAAIGYTLQIDSEPGTGTTIILSENIT